MGSLENILIHIGSVHRLPNHYRTKFDNYKVIVSLYYGGHRVTDHVNTNIYSTVDDNHTSGTIYFDQW